MPSYVPCTFFVVKLQNDGWGTSIWTPSPSRTSYHSLPSVCRHTWRVLTLKGGKIWWPLVLRSPFCIPLHICTLYKAATTLVGRPSYERSSNGSRLGAEMLKLKKRCRDQVVDQKTRWTKYRCRSTPLLAVRECAQYFTKICNCKICSAQIRLLGLWVWSEWLCFSKIVFSSFIPFILFQPSM